METMITEKKEIELNNMQEKMVKSGWGACALNDSIVEAITYLSEGLKVKGYIAYPKKEGIFPCLLWLRGGVGDSGAIDEFNARGMFGKLAARGYVVFAPQYRGSLGGDGIDEFGGDDIKDVFNIMELANDMPNADTNIWGVEGWSRGGLMAYQLLTMTDIFKAALILGGISNVRNAINTPLLYQRIKELSDKSIGLEDFNELIEKRSVANYASKISDKTPILIIHGTDDERVLVTDPLDLSYKLLEGKKKFRLVLLEGGDHFLKSHRAEVDRMRVGWFKDYLK